MSKFVDIFWNRTEGRLRAGIRLAIHALLTYPAMGLVVSLAVLLIPDSDKWYGHLGSVQNAFVYWLVAITVIGIMYILGRFIDRRKFVDFGWCIDHKWWQDFLFGFCLNAVLTTLIFLVELCFGWVKITGFYVTETPTTPFLLSTLFILLFLIAAGFEEEAISRGYQLKNLSEGFGSLGKLKALLLAGLLTSITFGLSHLQSPHATIISTVNLSLSGAVYAVAYLLTGRLALSAGMHVSWNFFEGVVCGFPVSGYRLFPQFVQIEQSGPELVTGGAFGPEAGLIRWPAFLIAIAVIVLWVKLRTGSISPERDMTIHEPIGS